MKVWRTYGIIPSWIIEQISFTLIVTILFFAWSLLVLVYTYISKHGLLRLPMHQKYLSTTTVAAATTTTTSSTTTTTTTTTTAAATTITTDGKHY